MGGGEWLLLILLQIPDTDTNSLYWYPYESSAMYWYRYLYLDKGYFLVYVRIY